MKKTTLVLALLLGTFALTACEETWHGMGRDMEETGEHMQNQYN
jgi:predicted small secreted protein